MTCFPAVGRHVKNVNMQIQSKDLYVLALLGITSWIFLDFISIVTNGPIFAILNHPNILIFGGMIILLVAITYIIFNIYTHIMFYVQSVFTHKGDQESGTSLSAILPQSLILLALYIVLLISQALWYIYNTQTF